MNGLRSIEGELVVALVLGFVHLFFGCEGTRGELFIDPECNNRVLGGPTRECRFSDEWTALAVQTCEAEQRSKRGDVVFTESCGSLGYRMVRFDCCLPPSLCTPESLRDTNCVDVSTWIKRADEACRHNQQVRQGDPSFADDCGEGTAFHLVVFRCCLP